MRLASQPIERAPWHDTHEYACVLFIRRIDEGRTINHTVVVLGPREGFTVPKGVRHRTRAPERTVILMIETSSVIPTGG